LQREQEQLDQIKLRAQKRVFNWSTMQYEVNMGNDDDLGSTMLSGGFD